MGIPFGLRKPLTGFSGGWKNTWRNIIECLPCSNVFPKIAGVDQHWRKYPGSANPLSCSPWPM